MHRRLGLPVLEVAAAAASRATSRHGLRFDVLGDVAQNDGEEGHQTRHFRILNAVHDVLRRAFGAQVKKEPRNYEDYSDHRPDIELRRDKLCVYDLKVFAPIGSKPGEVEQRGAFVGMGNTEPDARAVVLGRSERGTPSDGPFRPRTGEGYVSAQRGDYERARACGVQAQVLLVETFGGFGAGLRDLLKAAVECKANRLTSAEYDETTWSARTWRSFAVQRIGVAVQCAVAFELRDACGMSFAGDPRGALGCGV